MKKRVLIIDDEEDFCHFVKLNLERTDEFEVITALNGMQGIEIAKEQKPDIILLDLLMPEMEGSEVAEVLLQDNATRGIPIIFVTALAQRNEVKSQEGRIGGRIFLAKPITPAELVTNIKSTLEDKGKI